MTETLSMAQLVTIVDGHMVCSMGDVYKALNHLTGQSLFTHQLPNASRRAEPYLVELFPWLSECTIADGQVTDWDSAAAALQPYIDAHGDAFHVDPMPLTAEFVDPIGDLEAMVGKDRVIQVVVPETEAQR